MIWVMKAQSAGQCHPAAAVSGHFGGKMIY
jgi:hypothetical protein